MRKNLKASGNNFRGRKKPVISRVFRLLIPFVATKWQHFLENNCNWLTSARNPLKEGLRAFVHFAREL